MMAQVPKSKTLNESILLFLKNVPLVMSRFLQSNMATWSNQYVDLTYWFN